jgi:phosphatidylserine decarboxylase
MKFHKEGYPTLIISLLFIIALLFLIHYFFFDYPYIRFFAYFISVLLLITVLQFFRHPSRNTNINEQHVIAPADGKVVVIEEVEETEFFKDKRIQVSIFMSPINVHVNRYPISGTVKYAKYHPGKYLVAWHPKSSTENERTTIVVETDDKKNVLFRQIAGAMARRIVYYCKEGDKAAQGAEFGFIKFGSRVDVFLPLGSEIKVQLNQKVIGGETILADI